MTGQELQNMLYTGHQSTCWGMIAYASYISPSGAGVPKGHQCLHKKTGLPTGIFLPQQETCSNRALHPDHCGVIYTNLQSVRHNTTIL